MKKAILAFVLLLNLTSFSQIFEPVKWSTAVEKISETEYNLVSTATIDSGWHLYSQDVPEDGPIPTTFTYDDEAGALKIVGNTSEEKGHTVNDPVFEMKIKFFEKSARFVQKVTVVGDKTTVNAFVEFMVCNDARCLPPTEVDLVFDLSKSSTASVSTEPKEKENSTTSPSKKESKKGLWGIFFIAFLSGFAALLTPCVFPMIPMTVSFFTKQSKSKAAGIRNAVIYGLSIIAIYVALGSGVTAIFGADALNALSTNVWFNIIFFLLLIIFAVSFLGI